MSIPDGWLARLTDTSVDFAVPAVGEIADADLLTAQRQLAEVRRRIDSASASFAAEIAHRSRRELGHDGLAQRLGARTPQILVQRVTGATAREAQTLVRVGSMIADAIQDAAAGSDPTRTDDADSRAPWLAAVAHEVAAGRLSIAAADAIQAGLGTTDNTPDPTALVLALTHAAQKLVRDAASHTVEQLAIRAREARDEIDVEGVRDRERLLRERRYLHLTPQGDGMTRINGLLDPESAAVIVGAYDAATSPRRGGPRFVDPTQAARADAISADPRTTEQIAVDSFVELIRIATLADPGEVLGRRGAAVQVIVTERDLSRRSGFGKIEGQSSPVSIDTVERHICESGIVPILFDSGGQSVNVGRDQRLFNRRQRIGMAARDGGCRFPDCDRPPSWTEAHHIDEWMRDFGKTDIADGILLCRHHHLLIHDNGWKVTRTGGDYFVVPPTSLDPDQRPIPAPTKSAGLRRLLAS
jgi:hypothetical protein